MNKVTLVVEDNKLSPEAFNEIIRFVRTYFQICGGEQIDFVMQRYPIQLCGDISRLSLLAQKAFKFYNKEDIMRNIHIVSEGSNERT